MRLTRADAATAASPDKGEVAGSIPASPTLPTRGKPPLTISPSPPSRRVTIVMAGTEYAAVGGG
jgi:hypothetical protein